MGARSANLATVIRRVHPGWLVALFAAVVSLSSWLPWLATSESGGGWASAIGGVHGSLRIAQGFGIGQLITLLSSVLLVAGALVGRGLSTQIASFVALAISLLLVALTAWFYSINIGPQISAQYGLYVGATGAVCAAVCSLAMAVAAVSRRRAGFDAPETDAARR